MRDKILIEEGAFSSDRHAILGQLSWHKLDPEETLIELAPRAGEETLRLEDIEARIEALGSELSLVLWPGVQYRTGQAFDCERIVKAAHRVGSLAGFDMAHSIGNLPLRLHDWNVDFAVWCSYKYLNAGPGAIGGCFVHERHFESAPSRLSGWWGHEPQTRFQMLPEFRPASGAAGWAVSNPPIFSAAPLLASLEMFRSAGIGELRAKSLRLTAYAQRLIRERCGNEIGFVTPEAPEERGCQLSLRVAGGPRRGRRIFDALGDHGIICDWREPDVIRIAPTPFYNRFIDVFELADELAAALKEIP
jgi:kynureninase